MGKRSAYVVWCAAMLVYVMAIAGRTSFGVAGLFAMDRYAIDASTLSLFTVIQLAVYASAQIPVGVILDKVGTRPVMLIGVAMMASGQMLLGIAENVGLALSARVLIGLGDATAFGSVIRLVTSWFPPRRVPLFTQMTSMLGGLGQVISSIPFAVALAHAGWMPSFVALGLAVALAGTVALILVRDNPHPTHMLAAKHVGEARSDGRLVLGRRADGPRPSLLATLREPGTKFAFWTHFITCSPGVLFPLLWGVPFLQQGNGWSASAASGILIVQTLVGLPAGPIVARFVYHHPLRRSWIVLFATGFVVLAWTVTLLWPGPVPLWLATVLIASFALAGSASSIAFDFIRTSIDPRRVSTGTGVAIMGGFSCALMCAWLIGRILDLQGGDYSPRDYRVAMASQLVLILIGTLAVLRYRAQLRRQMAAGGVFVPPILEALRQHGVVKERKRGVEELSDEDGVTRK